MKKTITLIAVVLLVAFMVAACGGGGSTSSSSSSSSAAAAEAASKERKVPGRFPDFVKDAIRNAPEDALIGIGMAKLASQSQSMTIATTRARAEISRQMNSMIQDMVRDYQASSEVDPQAAISFQENITVALSKSTLTGSRVVDADFTDDGTCWVVVQLGKNNTVQEINQAQAAARLAVPAMASFNAEDRMNAAFDKAYNQEVSVGDN
jgi:flagellar basal body-associated protein FliL